MIVRFGLDPDAIQHDDDGSHECRTRHRRLAAAIEDCGVLVRSAQPQEVEDAIAQLSDQEVRKRWEAALMRLAYTVTAGPSPKSLSEVDHWPDLQEAWASAADVVVLHHQRAEVTRAERPTGAPPEVTTSADVDQAEAVREYDLRRTRHVAEGESREAIWDQQLQALCRSTKRFWYADRYVGEQVARKYEGFAGLTWLLSRLNRDCDCGHLSLYTSHSRGWTADVVTSAFEDLWSRAEPGCQGLRGLDVWLANREDFNRIFHNRFLGAGEWVVSIDNGVSSFSQETAPRSYELALHLPREAAGYRADLEKLRLVSRCVGFQR